MSQWKQWQIYGIKSFFSFASVATPRLKDRSIEVHLATFQSDHQAKIRLPNPCIVSYNSSLLKTSSTWRLCKKTDFWLKKYEKNWDIFRTIKYFQKPNIMICYFYNIVHSLWVKTLHSHCRKTTGLKIFLINCLISSSVLYKNWPYFHQTMQKKWMEVTKNT